MKVLFHSTLLLFTIFKSALRIITIYISSNDDSLGILLNLTSDQNNDFLLIVFKVMKSYAHNIYIHQVHIPVNQYRTKYNIMTLQ